MGTRVLDALSEDDWAMLESDFIQLKVQVLEDFVPAEEVIDFGDQFEAVEHDSMLLDVTDVFPHAPPFLVSIGDRKYIIYQNLCVAYACKCTAVILQAFLQDDDEATSPLAVLRFDYRKQAWSDELAHGRPTGRSLQIQTALLDQIPQLGALVRRYHGLMRTVYTCSVRHFRPDLVPPAPKHSTRVGRNAPCPCGSGKKFKKCCGP